MTDHRQELRSIVDEEPGIHFNELVRTLDASPDKVQRLVDEVTGSELVRDDFHGKAHFYSAEFDEWEREALALLRRETSREVITSIIDHGTAAPSVIVDDVGIARSTLEWHCERLEGAKLIEKHWQSGRVTYEPTNQDRLESLLTKVEPNVRDTWIDRTERLFDHVLEEPFW